MTRLARVAFALLLVATLAAFFVAQRLKTEPGVVRAFERTPFFSPNGDGRKDAARFSFRIGEDDEIDVDVVSADGGRVRRVAEGRPVVGGRTVELTWDGRDDDGRRAPDGLYRVRVGLRGQGRSVLGPYGMLLDTVAPQPAVIRAQVPPDPRPRHVVAPGEPVRVVIRGAGQRRAPRFRVLRTDVDPPRPVRDFEGTRGRRAAVWDGRVTGGRPAPPGTYLIAVGARDRAGNFGWGPRLPPEPGAIEGRPGITVRGLAVQPPVKPVAAGSLVSFRVDARGRSYRWSVRRIGEQHPRKRSRNRKTSSLLAFRAPGGKSGVYLLEVRSGRWEARVPFAVQAEDSSPLLVVLPAITWLGSDPLDDPDEPDGIPNRLDLGQRVPYPRPLVGEEGLPAGFADEVAPLLVLLDRARVPYDVTTDLALAVSRDLPDPRATGMLWPGEARWVTRGLARRLRRYVDSGGRVALIGPGSLRASVAVGDTHLERPTPPGPTDAFEGRIEPRRLDAGGLEPVVSVTRDDPPDLPLFAGWDGDLAGFASAEELDAGASRGDVVAAVGQPLTAEEIEAADAAGREPRVERPALSLTRLGKGLVIRVGLAGWGARVSEGDAEVVQLTRNVVDLLRRVNPRPRSPLR